MKQNITLSLEKELIKKGKIVAAKKETSISKMLGELLKEIVDKEDHYEAAKRNALQILRRGYNLGGSITWKREDLYDL
jgi:hypothetical protein